MCAISSASAGIRSCPSKMLRGWPADSLDSQAGSLVAFLRKLSPFTKKLQVRASSWSWGEHGGSEQEAWFSSSQVSAVGLCVGDNLPRVSLTGQGGTERRGIETNTWFQGEGTWAPPCSSPAPSGHESPQRGPLANQGQQHYPPHPPIELLKPWSQVT